jgi:hypothetical protein
MTCSSRISSRFEDHLWDFAIELTLIQMLRGYVFNSGRSSIQLSTMECPGVKTQARFL